MLDTQEQTSMELVHQASTSYLEFLMCFMYALISLNYYLAFFYSVVIVSLSFFKCKMSKLL